MKKSITFNFAMNVLLSASNLLFSLLTFPYLNRVLLAEGMGRVAFAQSVMDYVAAFALLGIPYYGIKVCVEVRDNPIELAKRVKELQVLGSFFSCFAVLGLLLLVLLFPQLADYRTELLILSFTIPLKTMGAEHYFRATEQFSYITVRSILIRLTSVLAIFLFVKNRQDLSIYLVISVFLNAGSNLFNYVYVRKELGLRGLHKLELKRHLQPIWTFFLINIGWLMYANTDVIMLGYLVGDQEVGYYNASVHIKTLLVIVLNALLQVVLPRMIQAFQKQSEEVAKRFVQQVSSICLLMSVYVIGYVSFSADAVMLFLAGKAFEPAVPVLQWTIWEFFPLACSIVLYNVLVATSRERHYYRSNFIGLAVNVLLNTVLISRFQALGAGMATVAGSTVVFVALLHQMPLEWKGYWNWKNASKIIVMGLFSVFVLWGLSLLVPPVSPLLFLLVTGLSYSGSYFIVGWLLKEDMVMLVSSRMRQMLLGKDV